jgi:hypothetical protein
MTPAARSPRPRRPWHSRCPRRDDAGLSMVVTLAGLVVVALLVLVGVRSTLGSGSTSGPSSPRPASAADDAQAQQSLATALTTVATATAVDGSYVGVDATILRAAEPSLTFVDGPSTGPDTVSVASTSDGSGSVTLAARASGGTCWLAWRSPSTGAWYGARTGGGACAAQAIEPTPNPGTVSPTAVGWQQGSFPAA